MHRAKLLNRSGWKGHNCTTICLWLGLSLFPAIGNAQQGTSSELMSKTGSVEPSNVSEKKTGNATTDTYLSTRILRTGSQKRTGKNTANLPTNPNQQPQHRVSVAPQGGELGKKTGADLFDLSVFEKGGRALLTCAAWDGRDKVKGCVLAKGASLDQVMSVILQSHRESTEACERDKKHIYDLWGQSLDRIIRAWDRMEMSK